MKEIWKQIEGYENLYEVSNLGRVRSVERPSRNKRNKNGVIKGKILKPGSNPVGYVIVSLYRDKKQKFFQVHRLVAKAFIPNVMNKEQVNHIDGNKKNNNINNLEWATRSENMKHAIENGLFKIRKIEKAKEIEQLDLNNNVIKTWNSCREIVNKLNVTRSDIYGCCNNLYKTAYGFKWRYKKVN